MSTDTPTAAVALATDVPAHWPDSVRAFYAGLIDGKSGSLTPTQVGLAWQACEMLAIAYALDAQVERDGLMVPGSMGQLVLHPAVAEARLARTAATQALRTLGATAPGGSTASKAGAALAHVRHRGGK